jgi:hypothetical protein
MTLKNLFLSASLSLCLIGCGSSPKEDIGLSSNELAKAQGIYWYEFTTPAEITSKDFVGLRLVTDDEIIGEGGGANGFKPNTKIKLFLFTNNHSKITYAITYPSGVMRGPLPEIAYKYNGLVGYEPSSSKFQLGKIVSKRSKTNHLPPNNQTGKDVLGITISYERN